MEKEFDGPGDGRCECNWGNHKRPFKQGINQLKKLGDFLLFGNRDESHADGTGPVYVAFDEKSSRVVDHNGIDGLAFLKWAKIVGENTIVKRGCEVVLYIPFGPCKREGLFAVEASLIGFHGSSLSKKELLFQPQSSIQRDCSPVK